MARESKQARSQRIQSEYAILCEEFPHPECALHFSNPFELLVATMLSAQTTDKRVNSVTPALFHAYPTPQALSLANPEHVADIIHPLGFFRAKTEHLLAMATQLESEFGGIVPNTLEELVTLSGVGRKTANVVLGNAFGVPGFPVDTHVIRVTGRLRWRTDFRSTTPDPVHIEKEITSYFPPEEWTDLSHRLIQHGRTTCHARKPDCAHCPLRATCPSADLLA